MKALFVTPPYHCGVVESAGTWIPLGLLYLAGAIRNDGFEVSLYDAMSLFHSHEEIQKKIANEKPDILLITSVTATYPDAIEVLKRAKEANPEIHCIIGGVHPTFCYNEILKDNPWLDAVVIGEGEESLREYLTYFKSGDSRFCSIKGAAYRRGERVIFGGCRPFNANIDNFNPSFDLIDWSVYSYRPIEDSTLAIISTSRGCKQHCSFCSQRLFWQESWRARSPESVISEMEMLSGRFGVNTIMIADEIPTLDRERWVRILDLLIERNLRIHILLETRVDDIVRDESLMDTYRKAGVEHIYAGVESVTQSGLDGFKKGIMVEESKKAIDLINKSDMISETSFILGMPDESEENIKQTLELAIYYDPDMAFFLAATPWPYADMYGEVRAHVRDFDYRHYNLVEPVIEPESMTREELKKSMDKCFMNFYLRKMPRMKYLSPFKREFMGKLFRLLRDHSYLGNTIDSLMVKAHMKLLGSEGEGSIKDAKG